MAGEKKALISTDDAAIGIAAVGGLALLTVATGGAALPAIALAKLLGIAGVGLGTSGAYGAARATGIIPDEVGKKK